MAGLRRRRATASIRSALVAGLLALLPAFTMAASGIPDGTYNAVCEWHLEQIPFTVQMHRNQLTGHLEWKSTSQSVPGASQVAPNVDGTRPVFVDPRLSVDMAGTYDPGSGTAKGTVDGERNNALDPTPIPVTGSFTGTLRNGQIVATGAFCDRGVQPGEPFEFTVDVGTATAPGPTAVNADIRVSPEGAKPGERVNLWAEVTGPDGQELTDAVTIWNVGSYGGNTNPTFIWDGKEIKVELIVIHENVEHRFHKVIPAYGQAPPPGPVPGLEGAGKVPGPGSTSEALIGMVLPGLIAVVIGLLGGPRTTRVPLPAPPRGPRVPTEPKETERETEEEKEAKRRAKARAASEALAKKLDHLEKVARRTKNRDLQKWVDKANSEVFRPDGSIDPDKLKEAQKGLREALNLPLTEAEKSTMQREIDNALTYGRATKDTLVETGGELLKGTKAFFGGLAAIPGMIIDGGKVIYTTIRDFKYFMRGLAEVDPSEVFGRAWKFLKEDILPIDELTCWTDPHASWEERAWSIPSGIAKTLSIMMGFEKGRAVLNKPISGGGKAGVISKAAGKIDQALNAGKSKWTQWRQAAKPPPTSGTRLSGALGKLQDSIDDALKSTDKAERSRKVQQLYRDDGMKQLRKLQESGGLSAEQANELNRAITEVVDDVVDQSTRETMRSFQRTHAQRAGSSKGPGVRIEEVMVGDSGSSARGGVRSIITDADRTYVFKFNDADLRAYATHHRISKAEAYKRLNELAGKQMGQRVSQGLRGAGNLRPADVGYGRYTGLGEGAGGKGDAFSGHWIEQTTEKQGKVRVYEYNKQGELVSHETSGRALIDRNQMERAKHLGETVNDAPRTVGGAKQVLQRQAQAVAGPDVPLDKAGKAVERAAEEAGHYGYQMDPKVREIAARVKANPQQASTILQQEYGLTEQAWREMAREEVRRASDWLGRAAGS